MLVGLIGLKGSGKSSAADILVGAGYERVKFAAPLKAMLRAIGLTDDHIEGELKEQPSALLNGQTPRYAMQTLGTDWGRRFISDSFWVDLWALQAQRYMNVVVDDVRFPNECSKVRALGGRLIRIMRPASMLAPVDLHESETHILTLPYDVEIINSGTLDELREHLMGSVK